MFQVLSISVRLDVDPARVSKLPSNVEPFCITTSVLLGANIADDRAVVEIYIGQWTDHDGPDCPRSDCRRSPR